ncbi:hypothetical protein NQ315_017532 [Exocentrus adspersus]|uniref:protein-tyrosine-phosphatase n=1 Tax=Exocentrus adspersus TaxID=1586481 RepID=A0AAV8VKN1_9CUCU|nr:hypothetical protein NQ315_017532 [Exocentrus adspersus]
MVFLEFLRKVRKAGVLEPSVGPAVVHCSAGIGRSGTFCLVDSCLVLIEKFGLNAVDVKEILLEMRKYRMGLIQTPEQLRFSYQAIIEGAKRILNQNNSEPEEVIPDHQEASDSDNDEPPPLPPPRLDSLKKQNGTSFDRPLPNIPNNVSDDDLSYQNGDTIESYIPGRPVPVILANEEEQSEEDELDLNSENSISDKSDLVNSEER